jgi:hypothetical protein
MREEGFGSLRIPLSLIPIDTVLIEWIPVSISREGLSAISALLMLHLCEEGSRPWAAKRGSFSEVPEWPVVSVTEQDLKRIDIKYRSPSVDLTDPVERRLRAANGKRPKVFFR